MDKGCPMLLGQQKGHVRFIRVGPLEELQLSGKNECHSQKLILVSDEELDNFTPCHSFVVFLSYTLEIFHKHIL